MLSNKLCTRESMSPQSAAFNSGLYGGRIRANADSQQLKLARLGILPGAEAADQPCCRALPRDGRPLDFPGHK
jgi:hypothetical protein